jgi:hypothetical protein
MTSLRVTRYVDCPFSAVLEFAEKSLAQRHKFCMTPFQPLGQAVRLLHASTADASDVARKHDALLVAWTPYAPLFPEFRGALTVRPKHRGVWLRLSGQYQPPFGRLGKFFDIVIGRFLAVRTLHRFLEELGAEIEAQYTQECADNKSA